MQFHLELAERRRYVLGWRKKQDRLAEPCEWISPQADPVTHVGARLLLRYLLRADEGVQLLLVVDLSFDELRPSLRGGQMGDSDIRCIRQDGGNLPHLA